ncbi:unnamed protein product [Somion occarium]|uniref:Uncharacterized protein n=1 Tax=Somion occarium TaxID=3059160 RepID=A0ABP1CTB5_9APHY
MPSSHRCPLYPNCGRISRSDLAILCLRISLLTFSQDDSSFCSLKHSKHASLIVHARSLSDYPGLHFYATDRGRVCPNPAVHFSEEASCGVLQLRSLTPPMTPNLKPIETCCLRRAWVGKFESGYSHSCRGCPYYPATDGIVVEGLKLVARIAIVGEAN